MTTERVMEQSPSSEFVPDPSRVVQQYTTTASEGILHASCPTLEVIGDATEIWLRDARPGDIHHYHGQPCTVARWGSTNILMLSRALEKDDPKLSGHTITHCIDHIDTLMGIPGLRVIGIDQLETLSHQFAPGRIYVSSSFDGVDGYWACSKQQIKYSCYGANHFSFDYGDTPNHSGGDVYAFICYIDLKVS